MLSRKITSKRKYKEENKYNLFVSLGSSINGGTMEIAKINKGAYIKSNSCTLP